MEWMNFPNEEKEGIISGKITWTLRIMKEVGKYKIDRLYRARSYEGEDWKVYIRINSVDRRTVSEFYRALPEVRHCLDEFIRKYNLPDDHPTELIEFEPVK